MQQSSENQHTPSAAHVNPCHKSHAEAKEDLMNRDAPNESSLSMGVEKQTKTEKGGPKRNVQMSPTSSHCVENDHSNIAYDFDQLNLAQPSRNLYKSKNPSNFRSIEETASLCLPFKAMTSPSARNVRNGSLLAKLNEITD